MIMTDDTTDHYNKAVYFVTNDRKASTTYIQRKLQIGYNNAAALIERMERDGIVGPPNHVGKREILITPTCAKDRPKDKVEQEYAALDTMNRRYGPVRAYICSGCDLTAKSPEGLPEGLPEGWFEQNLPRLGIVHRCPDCALKNASRIATSRMSTEELMTAGADGAVIDQVTTAAQNRVRGFLERIARLREDAKAIAEDLREVGAEAKGEGYDWKILMKLAREAEKDPQKRKEEQELFDLYANAAGLEL
jgi:uncharacterized protein (UPF0335 family)